MADAHGLNTVHLVTPQGIRFYVSRDSAAVHSGLVKETKAGAEISIPTCPTVFLNELLRLLEGESSPQAVAQAAKRGQPDEQAQCMNVLVAIRALDTARELVCLITGRSAHALP